MIPNKIKPFLKKIIFLLPSIYRRLFIKNKLAFGERYWYKYQLNFLCIDHEQGDLNINLENDNRINFKNVEQIYTSHMLEHISEEKGLIFLKSCLNILGKNGVIRIEVPDVDILIKDYLDSRKFTKSAQAQNEKLLIKKYGFDKSYSSPHVSFSGYISCYVDDRDFHAPILTDEKLFNDKLNSLSTAEFCDWLISIQNKNQLKTHGHINWFNFDKLKSILTELGFTKIDRLSIGESNNNFDLSLERPGERSLYSLIVEARK
jgi:hypothetical protein